MQGKLFWSGIYEMWFFIHFYIIHLNDYIPLKYFSFFDSYSVIIPSPNLLHHYNP